MADDRSDDRPDDDRPDQGEDGRADDGDDGRVEDGGDGRDDGDGDGDRDGHGDDGFDEDGFDEDGFDEFDEPLDDHESAMVRQDLVDLQDFRAAFEPEGFRGVAVWCHDCVEEHFFPWDMLRENLQLLLETGETPVHEPAFQPEPDRYVPWDYARGYVDALKDLGVSDRVEVDGCGRCGLTLTAEARVANFCPRCGAPLLTPRLELVLRDAGLDAEQRATVLRAAGLPTSTDRPEPPTSA